MVAKVTAGLFLLKRFDQSSRSTQAPTPRYGSRVAAAARFGGSAGAGNGAGGIEVVVVVVTGGGTVIPVPAPTGATVGEAAGRGLMTASEVTTLAGGCGTVAVTPAATAATTGVGRTRACGVVVGGSVAAGVKGAVLGVVAVAGLVTFGAFGTGFFVGFFVALSNADDLGFTLTVRAAVLIGAVLITAVLTAPVLTTAVLITAVRAGAARRCALAGEFNNPMPRSTERTARRCVLTRLVARASRLVETRSAAEMGPAAIEESGLGPRFDGSLTPGNAFDMGQG
jgi:hypothetical protein